MSNTNYRELLCNFTAKVTLLVVTGFAMLHSVTLIVFHCSILNEVDMLRGCSLKVDSYISVVHVMALIVQPIIMNNYVIRFTSRQITCLVCKRMQSYKVHNVPPIVFGLP